MGEELFGKASRAVYDARPAGRELARRGGGDFAGAVNESGRRGALGAGRERDREEEK